jgi:D-3-phosphoglycerate dehydrogenase / 2-oxoglutarate reductase
MYKILTYNYISVTGLERFPRERYEIASEIQHPDAILLRSYNLHGVGIPETVKAVGRAGAGVNNIPVPEYSRRGIPVFNAPGANANAVKELVIAGMLLACRNICHAWSYVSHLDGDDAVLHKAVENGKKQFVGYELRGKTLGIIGLGAIGVKVANSAHALGMNVIGCDPDISVESAWKLSSSVMQASGLDELLARADFVSIHVPLNDETKNTISEERIRLMREGAVVLNFSRDGIVDNDAVCNALNSGTLHAYVCDFPNNRIKDHPKVIALPHLGASTEEAEDNCAAMVAEQVKDFIENGNIKHAVNFPDVSLPRTEGCRVCIANDNVPHMVSQISTSLADAEINILDLLNKSKSDVAYTLIDVEAEPAAAIMEQIRNIEGVLKARVIGGRLAADSSG